MHTRRHARPVSLRLALLIVLASIAGAALISSASALDINTEVHMPEGEVGMPYEFQFDGEEGCQPYNFRFLAGTLPPGLTVQSDGELNGTPTTAGTFTFWVELTDGVPGGACHSPTPSQGEYTVIIAPNIVITAALAGAKVGAPFNTVITATGGGTLQWAVVDGALPPGLSLDRNTGALTGVPSTVGTYPFTVKVSDDKRQATHQYSFIVAAPVAAGANAPIRGEVGVPVNTALSSSGGIGPIAWSITGGTVPGGLTFDPVKGTITGSPTSAASVSLALTATDVDGQTAQSGINLDIAGRLKLTTSRLAPAKVGTTYSAKLAKTGGVGVISWRITAGKLPRGLRLNARTGVLSGKPGTAGTYHFSARASDTLKVAATRPLTLKVAARS